MLEVDPQRNILVANVEGFIRGGHFDMWFLGASPQNTGKAEAFDASGSPDRDFGGVDDCLIQPRGSSGSNNAKSHKDSIHRSYHSAESGIERLMDRHLASPSLSAKSAFPYSSNFTIRPRLWSSSP